MILLPRGNPVKERIDPGKVNLPDALRKLQGGGFTGYLRFDAKSGTGIVIFQNGKLISALFEADREQLIAYDAIARIFEESLAGNALLDIYKLSPDLALSIHALLHGEVLYKGQELKLIDIKALLGKLKEDQVSGCLRIYTRERIALIFYRNGSPLGFFHDGSTDIETNADTSMSVARLPGAKIDVLISRGQEGIVLADLMGTADLGALWKKAQERIARERRSREDEASRNQELHDKDRRLKLQVFLRNTAEGHLGKIGASLADKAAEKTLPQAGGLTETDLAPYYENLAKAAKLVAGPSAISAMLEEMKKGAKGFLK